MNRAFEKESLAPPGSEVMKLEPVSSVGSDTSSCEAQMTISSSRDMGLGP